MRLNPSQLSSAIALRYQIAKSLVESYIFAVTKVDIPRYFDAAAADIHAHAYLFVAFPGFFFMRALLLRDAAHSTRADASFLRDRQR